ncbi:MAG: hypothetical protein HC917_23445, partial [Richelia sp. SM2_1_7]|nr:hypothetical protein [Richelia sp. SM2_1_7]
MTKIHDSENPSQIPQTFEEAVLMIQEFALIEVKKEVEKKQLYFHNYAHAKAVKTQGRNHFLMLLNLFWGSKFVDEPALADSQRVKYLIDICAASHDIVQEFLPTTTPKTARQRESGVSETATINKLINYIKQLNQEFIHQNPELPPLFNESDFQIIKKTISATICLFDTSDNSIYQPDLYNLEQ